MQVMAQQPQTLQNNPSRGIFLRAPKLCGQVHKDYRQNYCRQVLVSDNMWSLRKVFHHDTLLRWEREEEKVLVNGLFNIALKRLTSQGAIAHFAKSVSRATFKVKHN